MWKSIVTAISSLISWFCNKQLIDAGKSEATTQALNETIDNMGKANDAREEVDRNPDGSYAASVRDKYTRPSE